MTPFRRVAMLGIGLINGSLAAVLRRAGRGRRDRRLGAAGAAPAPVRVELGLCDRAEADPAQAVAGADLVVLGVPPAAVGALAEAMRPGLPADAIVTDVSSIKAQVVRDVVPHLPTPSLFVPGHPVAGTEHSGPGRGLRHPVRAPPLHPDPDRGHRSRWRSSGSGRCGSSRARRST